MSDKSAMAQGYHAYQVLNKLENSAAFVKYDVHQGIPILIRTLSNWILASARMTSTQQAAGN